MYNYFGNKDVEAVGEREVDGDDESEGKDAIFDDYDSESESKDENEIQLHAWIILRECRGDGMRMKDEDRSMDCCDLTSTPMQTRHLERVVNEVLAELHSPSRSE